MSAFCSKYPACGCVGIGTKCYDDFQAMLNRTLNVQGSDTTGDDSNSSADNQKIISSCGQVSEQEQHSKELFDFLTSRRKPFYIDSFRKLLFAWSEQKITLSKFVEELNIIVYNWLQQDREGKK